MGLSLNSAQDIDWVRLRSARGIGSKGVLKIKKTLTKHKVTISDFWVADVSYWRKFDISEKTLESLKIIKNEQINDSIRAKLESENIRVLFEWEEDYPKLLKEIDDRPVMLFVKSKQPHSNWSKLPDLIGVVGSRNNTSYGRLATIKLVRELSVSGLGIISGCMFGIDQIAHEVALESGATTIGVLGFGHDHWYPQSLLRLRDKILEQNGLLISEHPPSALPKPGYFAMRNRIISGLAQGVIVVEAAEKSGSLITAECAADQGRAVFAVPGPITSVYSQGTKQLINQGAMMISSGFEVAHELQASGLDFKSLPVSDLNQKTSSKGQSIGEQILSLLEYQSLDASEIYQQLSESHQQIIRALTDLELNGSIVRSGLLYELSYR